MREIATGAAILASHDPAPWIWTRVGGDALDLATLATGFASETARKPHVMLAVAAVAGVTAAVVGLIAGTTLALMIGGIKNANGVLVFSVVLALLFWSKSRWLVPAVILGAGLYGWLQGLIAG